MSSNFCKKKKHYTVPIRNLLLLKFYCKSQDMHYFSTINVQQSSGPGVHSTPLVATRVDARKRRAKN